MEVILKKTKITSSIVKQTLVGNIKLYYDNQDYEILGWCVVIQGNRKYRWILLYNKEKQELLKIAYNNRVAYKESANRQEYDDSKKWHTYFMYHTVCIYPPDFRITQTVKSFREESDADKMIETINNFAQKVEDKGQIYI